MKTESQEPQQDPLFGQGDAVPTSLEGAAPEIRLPTNTSLSPGTSPVDARNEKSQVAAGDSPTDAGFNQPYPAVAASVHDAQWEKSQIVGEETARDDRVGSQQASLVSKRRPWRVLRNRNYALMFWGQLISAGGTQMQIVAVAWQVYLLTHSAIALGLIGLVQAIPRLIFSLVGGVFADAFDRRRLLLIIELVMACTSTLLALFTIFHGINIVLIYLLVLIAASASAFEFPTRQSIIPTLVPREQMPEALSLSMVMMQLTFIIGPTLGGFVIAWLGVANTYWIDVITYFVVIGSLLLMVIPRITEDKRARAGIGALLAGFAFLRANPVILAVLSLDFCATFFGSPRALLPVYASDIFHVGPQGLGILLAATSIGAVALTPLTGRISRIARQGLGVVLAIVVWGLCVMAFGFTAGPLWLGALFLAGSGAADMVSMILRGLIIQIITPDEFRGRISAVNGMFVVGGPMLGQFESGLVAGLFTPEIAVVSGGAACIVAVLLMAALVPGLLKVKVEA